MSETKALVLGAGLAKVTILNICTVGFSLVTGYKNTRFQNTTAKDRLLSVCSCRHPWVCWTVFLACWKARFGVIRRASFGVFLA